MSNAIATDLRFWHNCPAPEPRDGLPGWLLPRYPATVRATLHAGARWQALDSCGVELRLASPAPIVRVTVGAHAGTGEVLVFRGDFLHQRVSLPAETPVVLTLEKPARWSDLAAGAPVRRRFAPTLWRIQFGRGCGVFYAVDALGEPIAPPSPGDGPASRWLAYGSSITHSSPGGYPQVAARLLGVDVLNLGLAGSCHAEWTLAEHFGRDLAWDFATVELGVNMRGAFTIEAFAERAEGFLDRLHGARRDAPLGVITHFTNAQHFPAQLHETVLRQAAFDSVLRAWVQDQNGPTVQIFEGCALLADFTLLTTDLLHPTEAGQTQMGAELARRLAALGWAGTGLAAGGS